MRVATYNVHRSRGMFGLPRPDRIAAVVAELGADAVALQEAQRHFLRGVPMLDAALLERVAGLRPLPVVQRPRDQGWRSNVVLVRTDARVLRQPVGLRLGGMEPRGAVMAELDLGEGPFRLLAAHLSLGAGQRREQARLLLDAVAADGGDRIPTLLLGDLNEWRADGSAPGVLAAVAGVPPQVATFPAVRPTLSLDRIMAWSGAVADGLRAHDTPLARRASDHLPLVADVRLQVVPRKAVQGFVPAGRVPVGEAATAG